MKTKQSINSINNFMKILFLISSFILINPAGAYTIMSSWICSPTSKLSDKSVTYEFKITMEETVDPGESYFTGASLFLMKDGKIKDEIRDVERNWPTTFSYYVYGRENMTSGEENKFLTNDVFQMYEIVSYYGPRQYILWKYNPENAELVLYPKEPSLFQRLKCKLEQIPLTRRVFFEVRGGYKMSSIVNLTHKASQNVAFFFKLPPE